MGTDDQPTPPFLVMPGDFDQIKHINYPIPKLSEYLVLPGEDAAITDKLELAIVRTQWRAATANSSQIIPDLPVSLNYKELQ